MPVSHTLAEAARWQPGAGRDGLILWAVEMLSEQHVWDGTPGAMRGALRTGTKRVEEVLRAAGRDKVSSPVG